MFELLFLLLPLAAAYGFYMGRNSFKNNHARSKTDRTNKYLHGVDFLINNNKEKAMDEFIAYLDSEHPTFESTLALGNLFRQRGEVDRAISLHTSLAHNENIEPFESELAQIELACDFMSAGLLDRAEELLRHIAEIPQQRARAVSLLVKLYEQERDFKQAIAVGLDNKDVLTAEMLNNISHYYCELSQQALVTSNFKEAKSNLHEALELCPSSVRARLLLAELLLKEQQEKSTGVSAATIASAAAQTTAQAHAVQTPLSLETNSEGAVSRQANSAGLTQSAMLTAAQVAASSANALAVDPKVQRQVLKLCAEISTLDARSGVFCLELLKKCFVNKADPHYRQALTELLSKTHSAQVTVELGMNIAQYSSRADAEFMLLAAIKERPNIKLFSSYMGLRALDLHHDQESEVILQLKSIVDAQIARTNHYHCSQCGFDSSMMFWQCPSCRHWDSMRPQQSLDGD
ncbi:MAG: tetratricopeptide repeat protein [Candidatus Anaerobiospirillum pullicola]|uniref:Tetratricopeptide repeat protein n=1 Tax=Candidatus Anaerobiospirillum pullicola TaxID=2838451 RepID=A0A948THU4_9GAMM|nr:tetratricopeptide repeat protein [Candidatus Anaerobiospirillum pullicola]